MQDSPHAGCQEATIDEHPTWGKGLARDSALPRKRGELARAIKQGLLARLQETAEQDEALLVQMRGNQR